MAAILVLIPLAVLAQADVHYDRKKAIDEQTMQQIYGQTIECMHGMTQASLQQGIRKAHLLQETNVKVCGRPLYIHLVITMGWESKDAVGLLMVTSDRTVTSFKN